MRQQRGPTTIPLILTAFITLISISVCTQLTVSLPSTKTFCFNEDLPKHTLVKFQVSSNNNNLFRTQIMYLRELLHNQTSTSPLTQSITTQKFGIYRFCITNQASQFNMLTFQFLTGIHAKDYSSHTESTDYVASINNQANIAQMFIQQIKEENKEGLQIMSENQVKIRKYSIQGFMSVVFICCILGISYVQFRVIRNHMANRKYI